MGILFENCDLLLRGEDGGYSTLHGFLGVRGDTIDYIGAEKPTGEYEEHKSMEHKLLMPGLINCHNHSPMVLLRGVSETGDNDINIFSDFRFFSKVSAYKTLKAIF